MTAEASTLDPSTTSPGRTFADVSPVTGEPIAEIRAMTADAAVAAAHAAAAAQPAWAALPYTERRRVLLRAADILETDLENHVATFALEVGAVRGWAEMNIAESAATLREAAGLTSASVGMLQPSHEVGQLTESRRGPAGVSLSIPPWNAPTILATRSSAISLAVGNAVVIRPSEEAPLTAGYLLADALHRAGVPEHVVTVVTTAPGEGRLAIDALVGSGVIRRVAFIGSTPVGRRIAARAGEALVPAVMELGGKNATIVRADADLERWAPVLAFASFANSGQVCMCTDRILVHRGRYQELVDRLAFEAERIVVGDPRDPDTQLGPLINDRAAAAFRSLVADAKAKGAIAVAGGTIDGRYASATVLTGVRPGQDYYLDEGFVPIVSVIPVDDDDEAVAIANDTEYGLVGSVVSADGDAARRLARRMRAGAVHVNGPSVGDEPHVAFGGLGASGVGRLGGEESLRFFTEQRTFYLHDSE
ncbi:MAG: aldehyde dehydrogenase family protein [Microbacterium sp.]